MPWPMWTNTALIPNYSLEAQGMVRRIPALLGQLGPREGEGGAYAQAACQHRQVVH